MRTEQQVSENRLEKLSDNKTWLEVCRPQEASEGPRAVWADFDTSGGPSHQVKSPLKQLILLFPPAHTHTFTH